jgi:hypothetical protein
VLNRALAWLGPTIGVAVLLVAVVVFAIFVVAFTLHTWV